jgi:hypothetical protein
MNKKELKLVEEWRMKGHALVEKYPPESEEAAAGRVRLAAADELEHALKSWPQLVAGIAILSATLATTEPLVSEHHKENSTLAIQTPVLNPSLTIEAEQPLVATLHDHREIEKDSGPSTVSAISVSGARWFFGVPCAHCSRPVLLYEDKSNGVVRFAGGGHLRTTCPSCGVQHDYATGEVRRFVVSQASTPAKQDKPKSDQTDG